MKIVHEIEKGWEIITRRLEDQGVTPAGSVAPETRTASSPRYAHNTIGPSSPVHAVESA